MWSELARRVIAAAQYFADEEQETLNAGHLLLALALERRSPVAALLHRAGCDISLLRLYTLNGAPHSDVEPLFVLAAEFSRGQGSHYTGSEHLLFILYTAPEVHPVLRAASIDLEILRDELYALLKPRL